MKKITQYICIAGAAILAAACDNSLPSTEGEGAVTFDIDLSAETRGVDADGNFVPDELLVRIYSVSGTGDDEQRSLIRRYTSMDEIPSPLYLVAGSYAVKVEAGDESNTAFVEPADENNDGIERKEKLCFAGEKTFNIVAGATSNIEVECPTQNVKAGIVFDTQSTANENSLLTNVKIQLAAMTSTATDVAGFATDAAKAPKLEFTGSGTGYFLMPEGVNTLVWAFQATHPDDSAVAKVGTISNVEAGKYYKVNFNYSKTPDGYADIKVIVDKNVDEWEDEFNFKPQPEITSTDIDVAGENIYKGETVNLKCESINDLNSISLDGTAIFTNGEPVSNALTGVTVTKGTEATKVTITLTADYFATLAGANQALQFEVTDKENGDCKQEILFKKRGLLPEEATCDLWANTATLKAFVPEESVTAVQIQYRKKGTETWNSVNATKGENNVWSATTAAKWSENTTVNSGYTVYVPDTNQGIFANNTYEYQLVVDNTAGDKAELKTTTSQTIPYGDFEDSSLSCWTVNNSSAPYWGSGNNDIMSALKTLCSQVQFNGNEGQYCAKLDAKYSVMFAAGNLFTGQFSMKGTTGTVSFGIKYNWDARPTALKLKLYHNIGTVDYDTHAAKIGIDEADQASVYMAIVDWGSQHKVSSGTSDPTGVWSVEDGPNAVSEGKIIGYGVIYPKGKTDGDSMVDTEIPIYYYDNVTKPSSNNYTLIIAASTSRYGDYMNGCSSNEMYVDDFQWVY